MKTIEEVISELEQHHPELWKRWLEFGHRSPELAGEFLSSIEYFVLQATAAGATPEEITDYFEVGWRLSQIHWRSGAGAEGGE